MPEIRRKFDPEFREGAVRIVRETKKPIAVIARDLGVSPGTLGNRTRRSSRGSVRRTLSSGWNGMSSDGATLIRVCRRCRRWWERSWAAARRAGRCRRRRAGCPGRLGRPRRG